MSGLWIRQSSVERPPPDDGAEGPTARDLGLEWIEPSRIQLPASTGSVVLAWFPASVVAIGVVGAVASDVAVLVALALTLLGFFLVVSLWMFAGRTFSSFLLTVLASVLMSTLCLGVLGGSALLGGLIEEGNESGGTLELPEHPSQHDLDEVDLAATRLRGIDVSGLDLAGRDAAEADFDGIIAVRTSFVGASLAGASLRGADLTAADFTGACLRGVDLRGAQLSGASFREADVTDVEVDPDEVARADDWPEQSERAGDAVCAG